MSREIPVQQLPKLIYSNLAPLAKYCGQHATQRCITHGVFECTLAEACE